MTKVSSIAHVIGAPAAMAAVEAAVRAAADMDIRINAAVVDSGGNLAAFLRMPGAFLQSISIAMDKAFTSAGFAMPTSDFAKILPQGSLFRDSFLHSERVVAFGGGLPIEHDKQHLGGIGVSGGAEEQDVICAKAGISAINKLAEAR